MNQENPVFQICVLVACLTVFSGCGKKLSEQKNPLAPFSVELFNAAKANDVETILAKYSTNKSDTIAYLDELKKKNPDFQITAGPQELTDADIEKAHRDSISIFLNSYKEELIGEPVNWSAATTEELGTTSLIIWVKMPSGHYRGILIESVIETASGYKVNDWIGAIADTTKSRSSLRCKKALLECDSSEDCTFPRDGIRYKYEFVH